LLIGIEFLLSLQSAAAMRDRAQCSTGFVDAPYDIRCRFRVKAALGTDLATLDLPARRAWQCQKAARCC
jgi:hypothetical protein